MLPPKFFGLAGSFENRGIFDEGLDCQLECSLAACVLWMAVMSQCHFQRQ